jgi:hypothetical protein
MRFPLRLAAALYARKFQPPSNGKSSPIFFLPPPVNRFATIQSGEQVTPDWEWHTPEACIAAANRAGAHVVWLGGTEPLLHPHIGRVVSALIKTGRYVFLHTSGVGLRKRIHEFQPHPRLVLTLEVADHEGGLGLPASPGASAAFLEAMAGARLSGFHRCAHLTVGAQTDASETARLFDWVDTKGLEGFVVSSGRLPISAADPAMRNKVNEIQNTIRSRGWRDFSQLVEESRRIHGASQAHETLRPANIGACEENA